jgi:hypothetical protein
LLTLTETCGSGWGRSFLGCLFFMLFYTYLHVFLRFYAAILGFSFPKWLFETAFFIFIEKNPPKIKSEMRARFFVV